MAVTYLYAPYGLETVTITEPWLANIFVTAIFTSLGSFVLFLRLLTILIRHRPFGREDWAIYAAYIASIGYTVSSVISVRWGVGLRTEEVPPIWNVYAMKATYAVEIFYYFSLFLIKMSILFMYLNVGRGLGSGDRFCRYTRWTIYLIITHFVTTVTVTGVQCVPMTRYWRGPSAGGFCINIVYFFYSTNIFTIVSDVLILSLPVHTLWQLQMPRKKKLGLIAIFGIGILDTIASGIRLRSIGEFQGPTGPKGLETAAPINTWSYIEIYLGITCASIPAIQGLFHRSSPSSRSGGLTPHTISSSGKRSKASKYKDSVLATTTISQTSTRKPSHAHLATADEDDDVVLEHLTPKGVAKSPSQTALRSAVMAAAAEEEGSLKNYPRSASRGTDLSYFSNGTASPFSHVSGPTREVREGI